MPPVILKIVQLMGSTLLTMLTSLLTGPMIEWVFWWLAEKLAAMSSTTWDDELITRMKEEREEAKKRAFLI